MVLEEDEISNAIGDTEVEWIVYGFKSNKDFAYAVKFIDKADAGKFETFLKTEAEEEIDYVRLGKIIVFGTKVAVNAVT